MWRDNAFPDDSGVVLIKYIYSPLGETPSLTGTIFGFTGSGMIPKLACTTRITNPGQLPRSYWEMGHDGTCSGGFWQTKSEQLRLVWQSKIERCAFAAMEHEDAGEVSRLPEAERVIERNSAEK